MCVVIYGVGMRSAVWRAGAAAAVVLVALAVGGCVGEEPDGTPSPEPTATPLFGSDEEALAAAEEAYGRYQAVSDAILSDGGANPERLLEVATEEKLQYELDGYDELRSNGYVAAGRSEFDRMTIQNRDDSSVTVYVCDDITSLDVLGPDGSSVVAPDRPDRFPRTVTFTPNSELMLIVSNTDEWTGEDFCA